MKEIWKDIKGYEGLYQVSNMGRVKSLDRIVDNSSSYSGKTTYKSTILKLKKGKNGYKEICLYKEGTRSYRRVHRLVAETFIPNPNNYPIVNHKDEVKDNNCIDNLEWCTYKYNSNYGTAREKNSKSQMKGKKHCKKVRCITTGKEFESLKDAGEFYNCNLQSRMNKLKKDSYRTCGELPDGTPLRWEYID